MALPGFLRAVFETNVANCVEFSIALIRTTESALKLPSICHLYKILLLPCKLEWFTLRPNKPSRKAAT